MTRPARDSIVAALLVAAGAAGGAQAALAETGRLSIEPIGAVRLGRPGPAVYEESLRRLYVVDETGSLEILGLDDPAAPERLTTIAFSTDRPTGVALAGGGVVVSTTSADAAERGALSFYDLDGALLWRCPVGVGPKMVAVTPNGRFALTADEGAPSADYLVDPPGGVAIVDLPKAAASGCDDAVRMVGFERFEPWRASLAEKGLRVTGPFATLAQDIEPEHISVSANSRFAWVALQENNALALLDITRARFLSIAPLGLKDHARDGAGLDASDSDGGVAILSWPVLGMFQPGSIASYQRNGESFLVTANQGAARSLIGFSEDVRVGALDLDPTRFPNAPALKEPAALGRLRASVADGDLDGDGDIDEIHAFGGRSFAIWSSRGELVFDSGDQLALAAARAAPLYFNADQGDPAEFDGLSDDQGLAPSDVVVGRVSGRDYAFIAIGRGSGGVMAYDISDPRAPAFAAYRFGEPAMTETGPAATEGASAVSFIPAWRSPIETPLLIVSSEQSGALRLYAVLPAEK